MAKDLVRTRAHIEKFYKMRTELQTVSLRLQVRDLITTSALEWLRLTGVLCVLCACRHCARRKPWRRR